ncbi:unnamed protein product [Trifolium pratense]|uniref:Uncharacterized protein n=1 Tax=Trifolium pratense TaxID=57577 RepID=A0ACB0IGT2_TRIPR|nr:unnamed protein product [Trifolium pratense]
MSTVLSTPKVGLPLPLRSTNANNPIAIAQFKPFFPGPTRLTFNAPITNNKPCSTVVASVAAASVKAANNPSNLLITKEEGLVLYEDMILGRSFEDKCAQMYYRGKMFGFVHLYNGQEAVSTGFIKLLKKEDSVVSTYRDHVHALSKGVPARATLLRRHTMLELKTIEKKIDEVIEEAVEFAEESPVPPRSQLLENVFADPKGFGIGPDGRYRCEDPKFTQGTAHV